MKKTSYVKNKAGISLVIGIIMMITFTIAIALTIYAYVSITAPQKHGTDVPNELLTYSDSNNTVIIKMQKSYTVYQIANTIDELYVKGYEICGFYHIDTGVGEAHFVDYVIFTNYGK